MIRIMTKETWWNDPADAYAADLHPNRSFFQRTYISRKLTYLNRERDFQEWSRSHWRKTRWLDQNFYLETLRFPSLWDHLQSERCNFRMSKRFASKIRNVDVLTVMVFVVIHDKCKCDHIQHVVWIENCSLNKANANIKTLSYLYKRISIISAHYSKYH